MERFQDRIHIAQYYALERLRPRGTHVAHYTRGRGCRVYLCTECGGIYLPNSITIHPYTKRTKATNFQRRSKYRIKIYT